MAHTQIWQTQDGKLNPLVEAYTVGDDYILDAILAKYDVKASLAHARMLHSMGVLSDDDINNINSGLGELSKKIDNKSFIIEPSQEDCHTAIEEYLTENYGEVGKKIHTGRSRNDQSMVMMRLYMIDIFNYMQNAVAQLVKVYEETSKKYVNVAMPGYTHMQKAMPTTAGVWLGAYKDGFEDTSKLINGARIYIDQNPLGSASGFGISNFAMNRNITTKELNFAKTQENFMYCGYSRGLFENVVLQALSPVMIIAAKFANDMLLFSTSDFDFVALPPEFTTGSSIMPQKRNYDVFEIMRGNTKVYHSLQQQIQDIILGIGGGYQRDLQLTKRPFINALEICKQTVDLLTLMVPKIIVNKDKLAKAMTDDLFVTNKVYDLVNNGMSFRDAYIKVKQQYFS